MLTEKQDTQEPISVKPVKYGRGQNPNSRKNLRPHSPGQNGAVNNPNGYSITARLKKLLEEESDLIPPDANPKDTNYRDQIARTMVTKSAKGDVAMVKELLDRVEGKVPGDVPQGIQVDKAIIFILNDKSLIDGIGKRLGGDDAEGPS